MTSVPVRLPVFDTTTVTRAEPLGAICGGTTLGFVWENVV
jgi:hypothetical protein